MYTLYNSNGQITMILRGNNVDAINLTLQGQNYIAGEYAADKYYIDNEQAVEKLPNPSTDTKHYQFNYVSKKYELDIDTTSWLLRHRRNQYLEQIDRVNPVWYATLTAEQQQELQAYRQALLDVPQQAGFPATIEWPAKPGWL